MKFGKKVFTPTGNVQDDSGVVEKVEKPFVRDDSDNIINSSNFTPLTERDGIWLKGSDDKTEVKYNKDCFEYSIELIENMVNKFNDCVFLTTEKDYHRFKLSSVKDFKIEQVLNRLDFSKVRSRRLE